MGHLPWLVLHGAVVWELLLPVGVVCGLLLLWPKVRLGAYRLARKHRDAFDTPLSSLETVTDGQTVVLLGRLELDDDDGEMVPRFEDGAPAVVSTVSARPRAKVIASLPLAFTRSSPGLRLIVGKTVVKLIDPVEVLVGSREYHPGRPLRRLDPGIMGRIESCHPQALEMLARKQLVMTSLAEGDSVLVRGILHREAGDDTGTYREATASWSLIGDPRPLLPGELSRPRLTAASESQPRVVGPWWPYLGRMVVGALLCGLVPLMLLWIAGTAALWDGVYTTGWSRGSDEEACAHRTPHWSIQLAAASPFHRDRALNVLSRDELNVVHDVLGQESCYDGAIEVLTALEMLRGDCVEAVSLNARHGREERALALGEGCDIGGANQWRVVALVNSGRFGRASDLLASLEQDRRFELDYITVLRIHLLARRWEHVRTTALRMAELPRQHRSRTQNLRCLAEYADLRLGNEEALGRLEAASRVPAAMDRGWPCDLLSMDARRPITSRPAMYRDPGADVLRVVSLLEAEGSGILTDLRWTKRSGLAAFEILGDDGARVLPFWHDGLEESVLARLERGAEERGPYANSGLADIYIRAALLDLYIWDHEGAREHLARALDLPGIDRTESCTELRVVSAFVDLDAGDVESAAGVLEELVRTCDQRRRRTESICTDFEQTVGTSDASAQSERLANDCRRSAVSIRATGRAARELLALARFHQGAPSEEWEALHRTEEHESWELRQSWSAAAEGDCRALVSLMGSPTRARFVPPLMPAVGIDRDRLLDVLGRDMLNPVAHLEFGSAVSVLDLTPGRLSYYPFGREGSPRTRDLLPELERVAIRRSVAAALGYEDRAAVYEVAQRRIRDAMHRREIAEPLAVLERM